MKRIEILGCVLLVLVAAAVFLCGYVISGREFSYSEPHLDQSGSRSDGVVAQARNYNELKEQIVTLVENAQTEGNIRLYDYTSDVDTDLPRACHEVMTDVPIGAYAVDLMSIDHTRILSYYDVRVTISYKRPREEILNLKQANSAEEFEQIMRDAIDQRRSPFAVQANYYSEKLINVNEIMQKIEFETPDMVYGVKNMSVEFFPETGIHKILLVELQFYETQEQSARKRAQANTFLDTIAQRSAGEDDTTRIRSFCDALSNAGAYVSTHSANSRDEDTPYGLLIGKRATSMGYAASFKKLCDIAGIQCILVEGTKDGVARIWNMVFLGNRWYHVDVADQAQQSAPEHILTPLNDMAGYEWDDLHYPIDMRSKG